MGEIISGTSNLAISISADEVESWTSEAIEILHEKIPQVAEKSELMHIDYDQILKDMYAHRSTTSSNLQLSHIA